MQLRFLRLLSIPVCFITISLSLKAQGFSFNCSRDTVIPGCNTVCFDLKGIIPDLYGSSSTYTINPSSTIAGCIPVYVQPDDPAGTPTSLAIDDRYSSIINIGFPFNFYGVTYNQLVASTNGYISFDVTKAGLFSHFSTGPGDLPNSVSYDRALVMGPYHDLDPSVSTSPTQRIQHQVFGTAPHRRWILSFYKVPLFGSSCNSLIENTHQIVLYESTGIIEVSIFSKEICASWNSGKSMVGIQDWNRTTALMPPNRKVSDPPWGTVGMNESWRFVPSAGTSLFKRVELTDLAGTVISTGTVVPAGTGIMEANFPNTCVPATGLTTYIIRSVYTKNDDPLAEVFGTDTVRVSRVSAITATTSTTATLCAGANDGTITVSPQTGTPPYTFTLDTGTPVNSAGSYTFTNVSPGPHTITMTDVNGCPNSTTVDVATGPALTTTATKTDVLCNGGNSGIVTVVPPSIGTAPFGYSLDGVNWQASNVFNNVAAGIYTVYFRSADICPGTTTITVNEPAALTANSANTNATCNGGTDGTITVAAGGGVPGYQYSLDATNFQGSNIFNVLSGNYTVYVKDANGCVTNFQAIVGLTNDLTFTPQTNPTICEGTSNQLSLTSNALQYAWSPKTGLSDTTIFNPVANPIVTTQYIVKVTRGFCTAEDTVFVNVNTAPIPDAGADGFICYGQNYQLSANGGTQYKWVPGTYLDNTNIKTPLSTPVKDVVYTLSVLTDVNGCASLVTDSMRIDVTAPIKVKTFPFDTVVYHTDQFPILAIPSDTDVINYSWSPSMGLSNPNIPNPIATMDATTFSPTFGSIGDEILYQVTASTIAGCKGEGYIRVKIYKGPDIYIPTAFSPNGDGKNDKLIPFPVGIKTLNYFRVYNRWGQLMFSTTKLHDGWDGTLGGKEQQTASFVWLAEAITEQDKIITKKGVVTLVR